MNFLLHKDTVAFDDNGDPLGYYNIIAWDWSGPEWTFEVIGSASLSPVHLDINKTKIQWHEKNNQVMGTRSLFRCLVWSLGTDAYPERERSCRCQAVSGLLSLARDSSPMHYRADARLHLNSPDPGLLL